MSIFVIMPLADSFNGVYVGAIRPSIEEDLGEECVRVDEVAYTGPIVERIHALIVASRLCVADMTGVNANVIYEVAYALAHKKQVILLTQGRPEDLPFDIRHLRVIRYVGDSPGIQALRDELSRFLKKAAKLEPTPTALLQRMLAPSTLDHSGAPFVVAASPLTYQAAHRARGGWKNAPVATISDHVGIRGLMQAFGLIYGLDQLPELVNPEDFDPAHLDVTRMNLCCIGSPKANDWTGRVMKTFFKPPRTPQWEFRPDSKSGQIRNPRVCIWNCDASGWKQYHPVVTRDDHELIWDYGLVIRGPNPAFPECQFLALAGRSSRGTEGCALAATDPGCLQKLERQLAAQGIDLDNHRHAFCAVISVCAKGG